MEWLPNLKIYLGKYHIFTEEEFEQLSQIRHKYKKLSPMELLEIFPEAGPIIKRNYRIWNEKMTKAREICGKYLLKTHKILDDLTPEWLPLESKKEIERIINDIFYYQPMKKFEKQIHRLNQLLQIIKWRRKPKCNREITDSDIIMAKQIPLSNFLEFNRSGFANCPFHGPEKTPSLKYYSKDNHYYCYGCQEFGDVINYVMKVYNLTFIEAVKKLLNK